MNLKGILIIGSIAATIAIVVILPNNYKNTPPELGDSPTMKDNAFLNSNMQPGEKPNLGDNSTIEKSSNSDFYIDENGSKHYIIKADDVVKTKD